MLWYDDGKDGLEARASRAAKYYEEKYGKKPNCCQVPAGLVDGTTMAAGMIVKAASDIPKKHLRVWFEEGDKRS